ncbi:hypothetical protein GCM10023403_05730 [Pseudonocardia benzenivorans]|jgi:hypothetical protein|uniref:Uncharacterized protein n=2 Tax=Pseudonocardia TaxID=1847 RepID=F4CLP2_PSEUX|nr:hypothetical protein Psed_4956 [Pseudonocardia dioxanivorans CB1190]GJF07869.1 hypothetical protein PSD17_68140 [Pseudonocardia sp. D17]
MVRAMNLSVHFVGGPADGRDDEYDTMSSPVPRLYLTDDDDRWRAVYQLSADCPVVGGRWQYEEVPDRLGRPYR